MQTRRLNGVLADEMGLVGTFVCTLCLKSGIRP